jgi:putative hydrolase of the HAD superfamily
MDMRRYEDIFFDLDRTLWDFETNSRAALMQLFQTLKLDHYIADFEFFHSEYRKVNAAYWDDYAKGKVTKEALRIGRFRDALAKCGVHSENVASELANGYVQVSPYQTHLFPGTIDVLTALRELDLRLHIITNGFKEVQYIKLDNSGLRPFFEDILCSEDVGKNKPNPEIFHAALERTGANRSKSMMVGDDFQADVLGAERCGIRGILFDPQEIYAQRPEIERITAFDQLLPLINKPF